MKRGTATRASLLALALAAGACGAKGSSSDGGTDAPSWPALRLLRETKLSKVVPLTADHLEASGVTFADGRLFVVFDNLISLAVVTPDLSSATATSGLVETSTWEAITFDPAAPRFYVMRESESVTVPRAQIVLMDAAGVATGTESTDVTFLDINKGFEGLAWLTVGGTERLLALCEGNFCTGDTTDTGHGRIKVLARQGSAWVTEATIDLPVEADFADYSDLALQDNGDGTYRMAIVSQESSALWLGTLETSPWRAVGPGASYRFPKNVAGETMYCTVEGVTFLGATELAFVSDKSDGSTLCNNKDESIHIFALP